jgi:serine/threonine-protein kinase
MRDVAIVVGIAVAGFAAAALLFSPVPVVQPDRMVPRLLDLSLDSARAELSRLGYRASTGNTREDAVAPRGTVIWQDPPPGLALPAGGTVTLTVSAGRAQMPVPDLAGLEAGQAAAVLAAAGFRVGGIDTVIDRQRDLGMVLGTRPSAGAARGAGAEVDLIVNGASR